MMKRPVVIVGLMLVAGCGVWRWTPATFTIKNESGQPIRSMTVDVAGKSFQFADIPPGETVSGSFHVSHEESLDVRGLLADGTKFADGYGYVVWEEFAPQINAVVRISGTDVVIGSDHR